MKALHHLFLICFLLILIQAPMAQTVEIVHQSAWQPQGKSNDFAFVEPATDSASFTFVATVKATGTGKHKGTDQLFYKLKEKAQELGANAFKLKDYTSSDSSNSSTLILDVGYLSDSAKLLNFQRHEKNVVYIFGNPGKSEKSSNFKIDDKKKELSGGTYYKYALKEGQEVKINKGGFTGATLWINWKENRPAAFITLTGFGLGGGPVPAGVVGMSFNTGRINYIDGNLGHLLTLLLSKSEIE